MGTPKQAEDKSGKFIVNHRFGCLLVSAIDLTADFLPTSSMDTEESNPGI